MALDLGDFDAYYDPSMTVTIGGKQYTIPPVSADIGLWARRVAAGHGDLDDVELDELRETVGELPLPDGMPMEEAMLGSDLLAELAADKVPDPTILQLAQVVFARIIGGDRLALAFAHGDVPNHRGPANRAQRRAAKKAAPRKASGSRTTSTAAGATSRKAVSGNTTKSQKPSVANGKASPGRKS